MQQAVLDALRQQMKPFENTVTKRAAPPELDWKICVILVDILGIGEIPNGHDEFLRVLKRLRVIAEDGGLRPTRGNRSSRQSNGRILRSVASNLVSVLTATSAQTGQRTRHRRLAVYMGQRRNQHLQAAKKPQKRGPGSTPPPVRTRPAFNAAS